MKLAVIGGGFSGVMLTRLLQEKGYECHLYEKESSLGGLCRSKRIKNFIYDLSGGHMLYSKNEKTLEYIFNLTGKENWNKISCNARIYFEGDYIRYPFEAGLIDLPKELHYECLLGYINASYERKYYHRGDPKNFYDWLLYMFGKGISSHFMIPFNQKKWNYNLKHINTDWVEDRVPSIPVEEVIKASIGIHTSACTDKLVLYYPEKGGFQFLIEKTASNLKDIHLSTPVNDLKRQKNKWIINDTEVYDDIISTVPLRELIHIIKNTPPFVTSTLESLWYNGVATVFVGLNKPFEHNYSWVYLPHKENGLCDTVTFLSNFSQYNAPAGAGSLVAEITYKAKTLPEKSETLVNTVLSSLETCKIIDKKDVIVTDSYFSPYGYPVYGLKYNEFKQIINNYLNEVRLKRFGRLATHSYYNVDTIIEKAFEFVEQWY
jgi:protoporphyrinogen oxidase